MCCTFAKVVFYRKKVSAMKRSTITAYKDGYVLLYNLCMKMKTIQFDQDDPSGLCSVSLDVSDNDHLESSSCILLCNCVWSSLSLSALNSRVIKQLFRLQWRCWLSSFCQENPNMKGNCPHTWMVQQSFQTLDLNQKTKTLIERKTKQALFLKTSLDFVS